MLNTVPSFPSSFHKISVFPYRILNLFEVIAFKSSGIKSETTKISSRLCFPPKYFSWLYLSPLRCFSYNTHSQHYNFYFPLLKPSPDHLHFYTFPCPFFLIFVIPALWRLPQHLSCLPDPGKLQLMSPDSLGVFCFSSFSLSSRTLVAPWHVCKVYSGL